MKCPKIILYSSLLICGAAGLWFLSKGNTKEMSVAGSADAKAVTQATDGPQADMHKEEPRYSYAQKISPISEKGSTDTMLHSEKARQTDSTQKNTLISNFAELSEMEKIAFLQQREIEDFESTSQRMGLFHTDLDMVNAFKGVFVGTMHKNSHEHVDSYIYEEGDSVVMSLEGDVTQHGFVGKHNLLIRDKDGKQIGHSYSLGQEIRTDKSQGRNIIFADGAQNDPDYFQFFISDDNNSVIGNFYTQQDGQIKPVAYIQLQRKK